MFLEKNYGPCIAACYACATVCDRCAVACFEDDDPQTKARCIGLVMDCAQLCQSAAALLSRDSEFVDTVCAACADICSASAIECSHHDVRYCRQCADACVRCANLCRDVARQAQAGAAYA
jgi:hypothetical protein